MGHSTSTRNSTEERALKLLGNNLTPEIVASTLGVTVQRISQLVSDPEFMAEVANLRFKNVSKHNEQDEKYDDLEDVLVEKFKNNLPYLHKPMEILKALSVINSAKRRGAVNHESVGIPQQKVVTLIMPVQIIKQFTTNINNQVIQAGSQELLTIQSSQLTDLASKLRDRIVAERNNYENGQERTIEALASSGDSTET